MAGPSPSSMFTKFEISEVLNEVLENDIMRQYSLGDDGDSDDDYTQSVTPGIHITSNSDCVNGSDEEM
jgi:hypothetical protein